LNEINFDELIKLPFTNLKQLKAIKVSNIKRFDFSYFISRLSQLTKLEQIHINNLKIQKLEINELFEMVNVLTLDNCRIGSMGKIQLDLEEFTIMNSKGCLNLSGLDIKSVTDVNLRNNKLKAFPYSLSTA